MENERQTNEWAEILGHWSALNLELGQLTVESTLDGPNNLMRLRLEVVRVVVSYHASDTRSGFIVDSALQSGLL